MEDYSGWPWNESFLMESDLRLTVFCQNNLQPTQDFNETCHRVINEVRQFFEHFTNLDVADIIVAGSYKTGTAIRWMSDIDVIVFLNDFENMEDFEYSVENVMKTEVASALRRWNRRAKVVRIASKTMRIQLPTYGGQMMDVDICPAFDNLQWTPGLGSDWSARQSIYEEMDECESHDDRDYYSSSLAPLQLEFVRERVKNCENMKNLIRLVKYWAKTHLPHVSVSPPGVHRKPAPSSYCLELLTISLWEDAGQPNRFSLDVGLKCVLQQLANCGYIRIWWDEYYSADWYSNKARTRPGLPYILDPSNPFDNVCVKCGNWNHVSKVARFSCRSPLLADVVVTDNWQLDWDWEQ